MPAVGYPENWREIADQVKEAAGWKCEHCGRPHDVSTGYVLTVHHLDRNPANCDWRNLVAVCQRCHLRLQARFTPGQLYLLGLPQWAFKRGLGSPGGSQ